MRQMHVQVPRGAGDDLARHAEELGAATLTRMDGTNGAGDPVDVVLCTVPNGSVGDLIDRANELGTTEASVPASGAFAFEPPAGEPPDALIDVTPRSNYEIVLAGQQAAGSWTGFLTYSVVAGIVVWLGLYTETTYLLVAAMLIAPFAGPAMNTAISIVSGRTQLLQHSLARYATGIGVAAVVCALLTLAVGQQTVPGLLVSVVTITPVVVLLPLIAGVAGAMYLVQSEHSSLISGAAVGLLVAASLAPPAGGIGMALALGRPELALYAAFLVALQLTGITATAVIVLKLYGLEPATARYGGDAGRSLQVGLTLALVLTAGLFALQLSTAPALVQDSRARDAANAVTTALDEEPGIALLDVEAGIPSNSSALDGPPRVVVRVLVEANEPVDNEALTSSLERELAGQLTDVVTHVDLTVMDAVPG